MLSPLSVWAWTLPPAGEGAPANPEEEEESVCRVGPSPETWNQQEEPAQKQEAPDHKNGQRNSLLPSAPGGS